MRIAIVSGKGGTGKSSITAAFVALSKRVVAIDCDVDASNLPLLFEYKVEESEKFVSSSEAVIDRDKCIECGICSEHCAFGAIARSESGIVVNPILCEACGACEYLCPQKAISIVDTTNSNIYKSSFSHGVLIHGDLYPGDDNSGKMIARLRTIADKEMEKNGISLQILDGPPGIGCPVISTITGMDRIVIVCEPTLSGIADLQRIYEVATSFCEDISVVINKCDISRENRESLLTLCDTLKLPIIAELPFNRKMVEAQINQQSIVTYAPTSDCARNLIRAYDKIIH